MRGSFLTGLLGWAAAIGVAHGDAPLTMLTRAAKAEGAVCLDGSPGAYYVSKGSGTGARKWYIHQQGCASACQCAALRARALA